MWSVRNNAYAKPCSFCCSNKYWCDFSLNREKIIQNWVWLSWNSLQCLVEPSANFFLTMPQRFTKSTVICTEDSPVREADTLAKQGGQAVSFYLTGGTLNRTDSSQVQCRCPASATGVTGRFRDGAGLIIDWPPSAWKDLNCWELQQNLVIPWFQPVFSERWVPLHLIRWFVKPAATFYRIIKTIIIERAKVPQNIYNISAFNYFYCGFSNGV